MGQSHNIFCGAAGPQKEKERALDVVCGLAVAHSSAVKQYLGESSLLEVKVS